MFACLVVDCWFAGLFVCLFVCSFLSFVFLVVIVACWLLIVGLFCLLFASELTWRTAEDAMRQARSLLH